MTNSNTRKQNTNTESERHNMSKNIDLTGVSLDTLLDLLADRVAARLNGAAAEPVATEAKPAKAAKGKAAKSEPEPEDDEDEDEDDDSQAERRAELQAMRITSLRKIAREAGFDADEVASAEKADLIESILDDEASNDGDDEDADDEDDDADDTEDDDTDDEGDDDEDEDEDDDEDDDEDEDEGDEYTREDLEGMSLKELKSLAKEAEYTAADIKGKDQEALIDLLLGDDEDEEDEDDEDDEGYTEADLKAMDIKELLALAKEWELKIKPADKKSKSKVIKALLAEQE